ncbi:MAG: tRNA adenosine(34) deaminase TadA [Halanaerobiales bacterium]
MANHNFFMEEALKEAKKAYELKEVPIGAVVVYQDEIIGRGYNRREIDSDPTAHAEMIAIKEAAEALNNWRLEECSLYVTVEPCLMCAGAMLKARIQKVVYGAKSKKDGVSGSLMNILQDDRLNHQVDIVSGFKAEECSNLLKNFFKELRTRKDG